MKNALDAVKANTCGSEEDAVDSSLVFFPKNGSRTSAGHTRENKIGGWWWRRRHFRTLI